MNLSNLLPKNMDPAKGNWVRTTVRPPRVPANITEISSNPSICVKIEEFASRKPIPRAGIRYPAWIVLGLVFTGHRLTAESVEGITFAIEPGEIYVPLSEASEQLHWPVTFISKRPAGIRFSRCFMDGYPLVSTSELEQLGAVIDLNGTGVVVRMGDFAFGILINRKRVDVNLANQTLKAWQGSRLVLQTRISSGRNGSTPSGDFRAGPYKSSMHYSRKYHNAPMPWSVQIHGNIFIHGFNSVPDYPASHGCIRLPISLGNPAKFFYEWVDVGTPVHVGVAPLSGGDVGGR